MEFIARQLVKNNIVKFFVAFFGVIVCVFPLGNTFSECFYTKDICPNENVSFWLYSRETKDDPVKMDADSIPREIFTKKKPMTVLIHGYTGDKDFTPNSNIRPVLLQSKDMFVLSLDYNPLAREPCYLQASYNIKTVARCTANILDQFIENDFLNLDDLHIVGFSLGGQLAGMIANFFNSGKLKRITGLDPANPLFTFTGNENRLDSSDAEFVDVIHTDVGERGILFQVGHLDFYPNAGLNQPGCRLQNLTSNIISIKGTLTVLSGSSLKGPGSCNHNRAPTYYAESITSEVGFWGYACFNWLYYIFGLCRWSASRKTALMGYHASPSERGVYFLETNMQPPYARGPYPHVPHVSMREDKIPTTPTEESIFHN